MSARAPSAAALLDAWLAARLTEEARSWLGRQIARAVEGVSPSLFTAFSSAARRLGRSPLNLDPEERVAADRARPGWQPGTWSAEQAARARLVLALPPAPAEVFLRTLGQLFEDADLGESVALYQALPLLPHPERLVARAAEGVRSNMAPVFEAVALGNPYPAEWLAEDAFNQLVLKCLFVGSPLYRVYGLDRRAGPALAQMLVDYARERWAASRAVSPELWRCVAPGVPEAGAGDLRAALSQALSTGSAAERQGAALACWQHPLTRPLLYPHPELSGLASRGELDWATLGARWSLP